MIRRGTRTLRDRVELTRRALADHPAAVSIAVALVVNLVLLAGYVWSRGGETTRVRIEARGQHFTVYVEDVVQAEGDLQAPDTGGLLLSLETTEAIRSLPKPRGIDDVRVTDLDTGEELFHDDFASGTPTGWTSVSGNFVAKSGVMGVSGDARLALVPEDWRDVAVDVRFRNVAGASIAVRARDANSGVSYSMRPFRHFDNSLALVDQGKLTANVPARGLELPRHQTIKSLVAMTLKPYPYALLVLALGAAAVVAVQFLVVPNAISRRARLPARLSAAKIRGGAAWVATALLAAGAFATTLFLDVHFGGRMPHVPDELSYLFEAKLMASGRLSAHAPPIADAFEFFYPPLIRVTNGRWATVYPFGHPMLLAIGARVGAIWLIPPIIGAACVVLTFAVGKQVYHRGVGVLAALLMTASPFFLMNASNYMSHNTAAFFLLACLFFLASGRRRPLIYGIAGGLFFGLLFNTRPLTATVLAVPFGVMLLGSLIPSGTRIDGVKQIGGFIACGLLTLGAYYIYNYGTTGTLASGYQSGAELNQVIGFGGRHSVAGGIENEQTQMAFLLLVLGGWPQYIGLMFVLVPFMLGARRVWDWFLLACAVLAMGAWTVYEGSGVMYGPRYWYEATPFLFLLSARGADLAGERLAGIAGRLRSALTGRSMTPRWAGMMLAYAFIVIFAVAGVRGWLFGTDIAWDVDAVPDRASKLRGFNGADDRLLARTDQADLRNAIVLVELCGNWQCYGSVFWKNSPDLDSDVLYLRNVPNHYSEIFQKYAGRSVYVATYLPPSLVPFGTDPSSASPAATVTPRTAEEIAGTLPSPTPTPEPAATPVDVVGAALRDAQRVRDLDAIRGALQQSHSNEQRYPLTEGVQSACVYEFDALCAVRDVLDPVPRDPHSDATYWYYSDGASFILLAHMENAPPPSLCPTPVPEHLKGIPNLYCVVGALAP